MIKPTSESKFFQLFDGFEVSLGILKMIEMNLKGQLNYPLQHSISYHVLQDSPLKGLYVKFEVGDGDLEKVFKRFIIMYHLLPSNKITCVIV